MSTLKDIIHQNKNFKEFALGYGRHISQLLEKLDTDSLEKIVDGFNEARLKSKTIFVIGNGGSAASASHMANDLALGPRHHHEGTLRVVALTDNVPVLTATGNDLGYEQIFLRQLKVYYRPGDQLLVISASGNSSNLINSAQWVKAQGGTVWGFLG